MRNDILQSLFGGRHISGGKHKQTIKQTCQMNILSRGFNYLDVSPAVLAIRLFAFMLISGLISTPTT
jgi:hypothetical protein